MGACLPPAAQNSLGKQVHHAGWPSKSDEFALLVESIIVNHAERQNDQGGWSRSKGSQMTY